MDAYIGILKLLLKRFYCGVGLRVYEIPALACASDGRLQALSRVFPLYLLGLIGSSQRRKESPIVVLAINRARQLQIARALVHIQSIFFQRVHRLARDRISVSP